MINADEQELYKLVIFYKPLLKMEYYNCTEISANKRPLYKLISPTTAYTDKKDNNVGRVEIVDE